MNLRRTGDRIAVDGDYQHRAIHGGPAVQRHWHRSKLLLVDGLLNLKRTDRVLDIGCGSGVVAGHLGKSASYVLGIDGNPGAVAFARSQYGCATIEFSEGLIDRMEIAPASFQVAVCLEVIEHIYEPQAREMLSSLATALAPGGTLLLTTPNYASFWPAIEFALDFVGAVPHLREDQHVCRYTHSRLRRLCRSVGLETLLERSICTAGPWLAPISEGLATRATNFEIRHAIPCGIILAHLCRKP